MKAFIAILLVAAVSGQMSTLDLLEDKERMMMNPYVTRDIVNPLIKERMMMNPLMTRDIVNPLVTRDILSPLNMYKGPFSLGLYGHESLLNHKVLDYDNVKSFKNFLYNPLLVNKMHLGMDIDDMDIPMVPGMMTLREMIRMPIFMEYMRTPMFRQFWPVPAFRMYLMTPHFQMYWTNPMFIKFFEVPSLFYKYVYPMVYSVNKMDTIVPTWMKHGMTRSLIDIPEYRTFNTMRTPFLWNIFGRGRGINNMEYERFLLEKLLKTIKVTKPDVTEVRTDVKVEKPDIVRVDEQTYGKFVDPLTQEMKLTPVGVHKVIEEEVGKKVVVPTMEVESPLPTIFRKNFIGSRYVNPKMIPMIMKMRKELPVLGDVDMTNMDVEDMINSIDTITTPELDTYLHHIKKIFGVEDIDELRRHLIGKDLTFDVPKTDIDRVLLERIVRNKLFNKVPLTYGNPLLTPGGVPSILSYPKKVVVDTEI